MSISNFLSIGEVEIEFPNQGMLLIEGWNHDTQSCNGAGKSSVLSAASWCLYGRLPRGITSTSVTRSGEKSTSVSLKCASSDGHILVQRTRGPNGLFYAKNDEDLRPIDQEQLDELLGIPYERFLQVAYFAQGLGQRFLDLSDTDKKQLFLDLSNSVDYASAKQKVEAKLKSLLSRKSELQRVLDGFSVRLEELSTTKINEKEIKSNIGNYKSQRKNHLLELDKLQLLPPDLADHKALLSKLRSQLSKIQEAKGELRQLHSQLKQVSAPVEKPTPTPCPHCGEALTLDEDTVVACDTKALEESYAKLLQKQSAKMQEIRDKMLTVDTLVSKEERTRDAIQACEQEMVDLSADYEKQKERSNSINQAISKLDSAIEMAEAELSRAQAVSSRFATLSQERDKTMVELESLDSDILVLSEAVSVLGPSGIQAYVLDSIIDQFNEYVKETLSEAWPSMSYELLSFKENKSGAVSTRFSDSVSIDGRATTIGAMSGGELRCLSIAIDLAVSKVYSLYSGVQVAPLILDEPFNHMDSTNRERAISILQTVANDTTIVVVDHANEVKGLFDSIVTVEKKGGISAIRVE